MFRVVRVFRRSIMPRESLQTKTARAQEIIAGLRRAYPEAHCELNYSNPLELLIATILSAQCTDKQVNLVTAGPFSKHPATAAPSHPEAGRPGHGHPPRGFFLYQTE